MPHVTRARAVIAIQTAVLLDPDHDPSAHMLLIDNPEQELALLVDMGTLVYFGRTFWPGSTCASRG